MFRSSIKKSKYLGEYGAYVFLRTFLRFLPFNFLMTKGDRIGGWIFRCLGIRSDVALANLRYAFGDQYKGQPIDIIAQKLNGHLFKMILELANINKIIKQMDKYVEIRNLEIFKYALRKGKGVLMATGHFGNFELGALAMAWAGMPISLLIKQIRNPFIDRDLKHVRECFGSEIYDVNDAGIKILSSLKKNRIICMLGDQDVGLIRGTMVEFFGHPTSTPIGTARIALQTQSPIIPCYTYRKEDGTHVVEVEPPMDVNYSRSMREKEIQRITQEISLTLERWISAHPEQYFWIHRRWKSTPDGKWLYKRKK